MSIFQNQLTVLFGQSVRFSVLLDPSWLTMVNPWVHTMLYSPLLQKCADHISTFRFIFTSTSCPDYLVLCDVLQTICMVGVAERYKELSKFNLRQLTSPKP